MSQLLAMDDLSIVEVTQPVDELIYEVLGLRYRQPLPLLDQFEHGLE